MAATDSWAVVTGASAGIGEAFARALAARGHRLVLAARRGERLTRLAQQLGPEQIPAASSRSAPRGARTGIRVVQADLATGDGRDRLWQEVLAVDPVELLVNNAGFGLQGAFVELSLERQLELLQINVVALTDLAHRFLRLRRERHGGGGALINVASVVAFRPVYRMAIYAASKSYVLSLSEALDRELGPSGTRVLALCPGPVPTEFQQVAGYGLDPLRRSLVVDADQVAREGLAALERGERVWVPGLRMRLASSAMRLLPRGLVARMASPRRGQ